MGRLGFVTLVVAAGIAAVVIATSGGSGGTGLNPTRVHATLQNAWEVTRNGQAIQWQCAQGGGYVGFQGITCFATLGVNLQLAGAPDSQPVYDINDDGGGCFTASVEKTSDANYADMP
jgi:hypothetical protein